LSIKRDRTPVFSVNYFYAVGRVVGGFGKAASPTPVTIEILDAGGMSVAAFSSDPAATPAVGGRGARGGGARGGGGIPNTSPLWRQMPEPFSTAAGMHRINWPPAGSGARGGGPPVTGSFTVRLTVNGQTFTQPLTIKPDPRAK
jgi:hypothetical protein